MQAYEFMDTAIMVLRKKNSQISFLHVYHHASTFAPCWWAAVNFAPGGGTLAPSYPHGQSQAAQLRVSVAFRASHVFKGKIS